jgi:hypothetical protein
MRNLTFLFLVLISISACSNSPITPAFYGGDFDTTNAINVSELTARMEGQNRLETVISGTIQKSCQSEGCWLILVNESNNAVFVDWDHKFNTPFDISGRRAFAIGYAYIDTTDGKRDVAFKATAVHL